MQLQSVFKNFLTYTYIVKVGSTTFVPIYDWAHTIEPTRLCPHTFVPRHVCAHTRLCPDTFVPHSDCAHTRLYPHTIVPTHVCAQTRLCPHTFVPAHDCAQTRLCPHTIDCAQTRLCPHTFVPTHVCALTCYNRVVTIITGHKCVWAQILYWIRNKISTNAVQYIQNSSISLYSYTIWPVKIVHEARQHLVKRLEVLRFGNRWILTHMSGR